MKAATTVTSGGRKQIPHFILSLQVNFEWPTDISQFGQHITPRMVSISRDLYAGALAHANRITCSQCGKRRSKTWFSKNALASLRQRIYRDGSAALSSSHMKSIRCTECASNPLQSERICKICGESKTLDGFARNQRKYQEPVSCVFPL